MAEDLDYTPPNEVLKEYEFIWRLPDGRWCGIHRLLFHWTVHIDIDDDGYADRYCFDTYHRAVTSLLAWDGKGDMPDGWQRHPATGRRRNLATGEEWIAD